MSIQGRTIEEKDETSTISRYFEFLGTSESSVQTKEMDDSYIHYEYKNVPLSVEITDSHEHEYSTEGEIIKSATNETEGVIRYYCNVCGGYRDEVIPKLSGQTSNEGDDDSKAEVSKKRKTSTNPQTGDKAFPAMWIMLGSIAAITGIVEYKSRKMPNRDRVNLIGDVYKCKKLRPRLKNLTKIKRNLTFLKLHKKITKIL